MRQRVSIQTIGLLCLIGTINIAFNYAIYEAAQSGKTWSQAVFTIPFALAFALGSTSLCALLFLYTSGIYLGRAILLMGVVSIIGGSIFGALIKKSQRLDTVEIALLITLGALFAYRSFLKA